VKRAYIFVSVHDPLFAAVARDLRDRHGVETFGALAFGRDQLPSLESCGVTWSRIDFISDWLRASGDGEQADLAFLEKAEIALGQPNLYTIVGADRHLARLPYDRMLRLLEISIRQVEAALDAVRPDAVIFESVEGMASWILYAVAKTRGIRCIGFDTGRIRGRVAVYNDACQRWPLARRAFARMQAEGLRPEEHAAAEAFLADFRTRRPRPVVLGEISSVKKPDIDLAEGFRRMRMTLRRRRVDPDNVTLDRAGTMLRQRARRLWRHSRSAPLFEVPPPGEKFVLYPLHFQPEASTLVLAPFFLDQVSLIEDIARSLPVGHRLYVKEHFASLGRRSVEDYHRIKRIWNVRLVSPYVDSFDLLERASAVATITGTMGWEAILFERPVVAFGEMFYDDYPLLLRAGQIPKPEWPRLFQTAVRTWRPDRETLLRYVAAVLEGTVEAKVSLQNPWTDARVLDEGNVRALSDLTMVAARV